MCLPNEARSDPFEPNAREYDRYWQRRRRRRRVPQVAKFPRGYQSVISRVLAGLEANVIIDADRDLPLSGIGVQRVAMRVETIVSRAAGMAKVTGLVAVILQLRDKLGAILVLYVT